MISSPAGGSAAISTVADVMSRSFVAVPSDALFKQIAFALVRNRVSAVPVIDVDRRVVGVVSEADLLTRLAGEGGIAPRGHILSARSEARRKLHASDAHELMTSPAVTARETATISEAAHTAAHSRVRHLPVIDSNGRLVGVVSRADLLRIFLRDDDEIAREIHNFVRENLLSDPACLSIQVSSGVVKLTGVLERRLQVSSLVDHVRRMSGVVDIDDHLTTSVVDESEMTSTPRIIM